MECGYRNVEKSEGLSVIERIEIETSSRMKMSRLLRGLSLRKTVRKLITRWLVSCEVTSESKENFVLLTKYASEIIVK